MANILSDRDSRTLYNQAAKAVDAWLAAKAGHEKLSLDANQDDVDGSTSLIAFAKDAAILAIRRASWAGKDDRPADEDLAKSTPVASFVHRGRVYIATTGFHLGDVVPEAWQSVEMEAIVDAPFGGV